MTKWRFLDMNLNFMKLREQMENQKVSYYLVPSEDPHQSEYVDDYFKCRQYISGFTGSAGTFLAGCEEGWLWTDGRYFTQAEGQISSDITLMKQGVSGVPTILEFLKEHLQEGDTLGVNGFTISASYGKKIAKLVKQHGASFRFDLRFVEELWAKDDRPAITKSTIYRHDIKYSGEHTDSKLARVREKMKELDANAFFLSSLPDIAWLFNLRGDDIACTPLFYSYAWITIDKCFLFLRKDCISAVAFQRFKEHGISILDYTEVSAFLKDQHETVLLNPDLTNYLHYNLLFKCKIIEDKNPTELMKAIKNDIQIDHLKACHINDGIAMTKFMYWLKKNVGKIPMTERMISDHLEEERKKLPDYMGPSFETICAYKDHAAMMHYQSTEESDVDVKAEGMLLIDSGGQYYGGTTDVTRTFILGPISEEERKYFTLVLKSMLTLANAKFLFGCRGSNLDILAREPLWEDGVDYRCGTGHGVGYFLGVHEGPNAFRWRSNPENLDAVLQPGMVITDEPGVYVEGSHGIRHENELLCVKHTENEYGTFLKFEPITYVPFDIAGLDLDYLSNHEIASINEYQQYAFDHIKDALTQEEKDWYLNNLFIK